MKPWSEQIALIRTSMRTPGAPEAALNGADDPGNTDGQTDPVRTAVGDSAHKIG